MSLTNPPTDAELATARDRWRQYAIRLARENTTWAGLVWLLSIGIGCMSPDSAVVIVHALQAVASAILLLLPNSFPIGVRKQ